jgi:hypothetical protein
MLIIAKQDGTVRDWDARFASLYKETDLWLRLDLNGDSKSSSDGRITLKTAPVLELEMNGPCTFRHPCERLRATASTRAVRCGKTGLLEWKQQIIPLLNCPSIPSIGIRIERDSYLITDMYLDGFPIIIVGK